MALCRICDKKKQKTQEMMQVSVRETQEVEMKTQKLCTQLTELQEEKMAVSMQWEEQKAALIESIKQTSR
jgi:tRNA U54 and U55 pseudouridine synthase Pus10